MVPFKIVFTVINIQLNLCITATQKIDKAKVLMTTGSLMKVESIAESAMLKTCIKQWS